MREEIEHQLAQLVQIPSVTPKYPGLVYEDLVGGETRCNEALRPVLESAGCSIDMWEEEPGRANMVGVLPGQGGGGRSLILNGHIDTVPPGDYANWRWNDPFSGIVENGILYGLGSCDMKAGLVAQSFAAKALAKAGIRLRGDLILESVVGEETMDHESGTSATVKRGYSADAAIVTEPTGLTSASTIAPCSAGVYWLRLTITGKATHVMVRGSLIWPGGAGEDYGVNAIDKGMYVARELQKLEHNWGMQKNHPLFPAGHFTIGPNVMIGTPPGPSVPFVVPDHCAIDYIVIYAPNEDPERVREEVESYLQRVFEQDPWLSKQRPTIEWPHHWPAYNTPSAHPICETVGAAHVSALGEAAPLRGFPAVDDATWLERGGIPSISFGPGNIMLAHSVNEHIDVEEVIRACKVYATTSMMWCGLA